MPRKPKQEKVVQKVPTPPKVVLKPKTHKQTELIKLIRDNDITFAIGSAGTGKTFIATTLGLKMLMEGQVSKLVIVRPAIDAGEKLGFLPGDINEKLDPFMKPIYDIIELHLGPRGKAILEEQKFLEIAPIAFMRGRTLGKSFVIMDEAQNATFDQMKMFLTRIGEGSKYVICGDHTQSDIRQQRDLIYTVNKLSDVPGISSLIFEDSDSVRHPIIQKILDRLK